jgi:hypothetical protein
MRAAMWRAACSSSLGTALVLAALATAMSDAVTRVADSPLGAAFLLTPPKFAETPTLCDTSSTPPSALNAPLVRTGHHPHDGGSVMRAGQALGSACLGQQRLGGGRTVGV